MRLLLGGDGVDPRLAPFCELVEPAASLDRGAARRGHSTNAAPRSPLSGGRHAAQRSCTFTDPSAPDSRVRPKHSRERSGAGCCRRTWAGHRRINSEFESTIELLFREAWLLDAVLFLDDVDAIRADDSTVKYGRLMSAVAGSRSITILAGSRVRGCRLDASAALVRPVW